MFEMVNGIMEFLGLSGMAFILFGMASPSSLTDDFDSLLTTTLRNMQPKLRDNITKSNKVVAFLDMKGKWRKVSGGERIQVALMHAQNGTADIYSGYGQLNTTPQDGITSAFYNWTQMACSIAISRKEELQNSGKEAKLNLLEAKTMQAEASMKELLNNCIVAGKLTSSSTLGVFSQRTGTLDTSAVGPLPLPALIDATATRSVSIGNINGNTYSFWRNQSTSSSATTWAGYFRELSSVYNDCTKGVGGSPDLVLGDQRSWETYWNGLRNQERYVVDDAKTIDILGGSDMLKFRQAVFMWDEVVPDVQTNANIDVGTFTVGTVYFINSESMEFISHTDADFTTTPFLKPVGQDAKVAEILWMGALGVNNRRKNGVLYNVSRSIVA